MDIMEELLTFRERALCDNNEGGLSKQGRKRLCQGLARHCHESMRERAERLISLKLEVQLESLVSRALRKKGGHLENGASGPVLMGGLVVRKDLVDSQRACEVYCCHPTSTCTMARFICVSENSMPSLTAVGLNGKERIGKVLGLMVCVSWGSKAAPRELVEDVPQGTPGIEMKLIRAGAQRAGAWCGGWDVHV